MYTYYIWSIYFASIYLPKRRGSICLHKDTYAHICLHKDPHILCVHRCFNCIMQNCKQPKYPSTGKQILVYQYNGILLRSENKWTLESHNNMYESKLITLSESSQIKKDYAVMILCIQYSRKYKLIYSNRKWLPGDSVVGWRERGGITEGLKKSFRNDQIVHFKYVQFIVCHYIKLLKEKRFNLMPMVSSTWSLGSKTIIWKCFSH